MTQTINNAGTYIIGVLFYYGFKFGVLSFSIAVASTKAYIIYWVMVKIKQESSYSWILKERNLNSVSHGAIFGCSFNTPVMYYTEVSMTNILKIMKYIP